MIDEYEKPEDEDIDWDSIVNEAEWKSDLRFASGLVLTILAWSFGYSVPIMQFNWLPMKIAWNIFLAWSIFWALISIIIGAICNRRNTI